MSGTALAVKAALKAKDIAENVLDKIFGDKDSNMHGGLIAAAGGAALLLCVFCFMSAPLSSFGLLDTAQSDGLEGVEGSDGTYVIPDDGDGDDASTHIDESTALSVEQIEWYEDEADRLSAEVRGRYATGNDDVYNLPDWRWLWAYDTARSEQDWDAVKANKDEYAQAHGSVIRATKVHRTVTHTERQYDKSYNQYTEGVEFDNDAQAYYKNVEVSEQVPYYYVTYQSFGALFGSKSLGSVTSEISYFTEFESGGNYGNGWGDNGAALGAYQFDYRYALSPFLSYCCEQQPSHYESLFGAWAGCDIARGDGGLEAAWVAAYEAYPDEFAHLQDQYAYENSYPRAEGIMSDLGIDISGRRDCIKGLIWGLTNLFGAGGARHGLTELAESGAIDGSMTDLELATAICTSLSSCDDFVTHWLKGSNAYVTGWSNRYVNELERIEAWLARDPETGSAPSSADDSETKMTCANNYLVAVRFYDHRTIDGEDVLVFNADGLASRLEKMGESGSGTVALGVAGTIDGAERLTWLFDGPAPQTAEGIAPYLTTIDCVTTEGTVKLTCHEKLANEIQAAFEDMAAIGFPISDAGCYCFRYMPFDASMLSYHAYGCCIDINVASNPMQNQTSGTYAPGDDPYSVTDQVVAIWKKHGFYWGGDWDEGNKDYMHFTYTNN